MLARAFPPHIPRKMLNANNCLIQRNKKLKEKPDNWDTDIDGEWADQPAAQIADNEDVSSEADEAEETNTSRAATRGRGRGRGRGGTTRATASARKPATAAPKKKPPAKTPARGRKKVIEVSDEDEMAMDVDGVGDDDDDEHEAAPPPTRATRRAPARKAAPAPTPAKRGRQTQLAFAPSQRTTRGASGGPTDSQASNALFHRNVVTIPSDDEDIEDLDSGDDFVPMSN